MSGGQTALFVVGCVADITIVPLTLSLKAGGDALQYAWLALATFSVLGFSIRIVLMRLATAPARSWAEALIPTRFGTMITFGVLAVVLLMLPLAAHFG